MNENVGSFYGNQGMVRGGYANLGNSFLQPEYINAEGDLPPELEGTPYPQAHPTTNSAYLGSMPPLGPTTGYMHYPNYPLHNQVTGGPPMFDM